MKTWPITTQQKLCRDRWGELVTVLIMLIYHQITESHAFKHKCWWCESSEPKRSSLQTQIPQQREEPSRDQDVVWHAMATLSTPVSILWRLPIASIDTLHLNWITFSGQSLTVTVSPTWWQNHRHVNRLLNGCTCTKRNSSVNTSTVHSAHSVQIQQVTQLKKLIRAVYLLRLQGCRQMQ